MYKKTLEAFCKFLRDFTKVDVNNPAKVMLTLVGFMYILSEYLVGDNEYIQEKLVVVWRALLEKNNLEDFTEPYPIKYSRIGSTELNINKKVTTLKDLLNFSFIYIDK